MNFYAAKAKLIEKGIRIPDPINMEATEKALASFYPLPEKSQGSQSSNELYNQFCK